MSQLVAAEHAVKRRPSGTLVPTRNTDRIETWSQRYCPVTFEAAGRSGGNTPGGHECNGLTIHRKWS